MPHGNTEWNVWRHSSNTMLAGVAPSEEEAVEQTHTLLRRLAEQRPDEHVRISISPDSGPRIPGTKTEPPRTIGVWNPTTGRLEDQAGNPLTL